MSVGEHQNKVLADIKGLSHPKIENPSIVYNSPS